MKTDQQQLRDYLLGRLPEDLATEMDTRLFASNELNRELQDEQDSLIEDFVYSRLTSVEEDAFQAQCARSQMLQEKVRSFRVFLSAIERLPDAKPSPLTFRFQQLLGILSPALALLLCFASFLYTRELRRNALLSSQLLASSRTDGSNAATNEDGRATVVAFLSANVPRGASTAPEVKVPATAHLLELQVELQPSPSEETDWDVELLHDTEVVWTSAHVPLHRIGQEAFLSLPIDTGSIRTGSYVVRYSLHADHGAAQSRPFHLVK
jgi:anti-sigma factor RsiW